MFLSYFQCSATRAEPAFMLSPTFRSTSGTLSNAQYNFFTIFNIIDKYDLGVWGAYIIISWIRNKFFEIFEFQT